MMEVTYIKNKNKKILANILKRNKSGKCSY